MRRILAAAVAAWGMMACGSPQQATAAPPPEPGPTKELGAPRGPAPARPAPVPEAPQRATQEKASMTEEQALPLIRRAVAAAAKVPEERVSVDIADAEIPGGYVFRYELAEEPRRGDFGAGILRGERVVLAQAEANREALEALGGRGARPEAVAAVLGVLQGAVEPAYAVLDKEELGMMRKDWRKHVFLPRATETGFAFWVTSGEPPAWRVEVRVTGSEVAFTTEDIWTLLGGR